MAGVRASVASTVRTGAQGVLTHAEFVAFAGLMAKRFGWKLCGTKRYLVESRLAECAAECGCGGVPEYVSLLLSGRADESEFQRVADRITINETSFFRDEVQLECLIRRVMPEVLAARRRWGEPIMAWSAACSTGEEAYTLSMLLGRELESAGIVEGVRVVGTDVSERAVRIARAGRYPDSAARSVPDWAIERYFEREGRELIVSGMARSNARFMVHNLLDETPPDGTGLFDLIVCRNALMYFDEDAKRTALRNIESRLVSWGVLILGREERIESDAWIACGGAWMGCYRKLEQHRAAA